jgi:hypothetical protein
MEKFYCKKLNDFFGVNGPEYIIIEDVPKNGAHAGKLNGFYGKKHTVETKQILREKTLKLCEDVNFRMSRANYGEKNGKFGRNKGEDNGMYGKKHSEETKRKISEKAKLRYSKNEKVLPG